MNVVPTFIDETRSPCYSRQEALSLTQEQIDAGKKIVWFFRSSTSLLNFLKLYREVIAGLPSEGFLTVLRNVSKYCSVNLSQKKRIKEIRKLLEKDRLQYHEDRKKITFGRSLNIREFSYCLGECPDSKGTAYASLSRLKIEAYNEDCARTPWVPSLEELNEIVPIVSNMKDLFVWFHTRDGCSIRADLLAQFFCRSGVEIKNLLNVYFLYAADQQNWNDWHYHVALAIKIQIGDRSELRVIDPIYSKESPLTLEEWKQKLEGDLLDEDYTEASCSRSKELGQTVGCNKTKSLPIVDYGMVKDSFFYDESLPGMFLGPINFQMNRPKKTKDKTVNTFSEKSEITFFEVTPSLRADDEKVLASFRASVDALYMRLFLEP